MWCGGAVRSLHVDIGSLGCWVGEEMKHATLLEKGMSSRDEMQDATNPQNESTSVRVREWRTVKPP